MNIKGLEKIAFKLLIKYNGVTSKNILTMHNTLIKCPSEITCNIKNTK